MAPERCATAAVKDRERAHSTSVSVVNQACAHSPAGVRVMLPHARAPQTKKFPCYCRKSERGIERSTSWIVGCLKPRAQVLRDYYGQSLGLPEEPRPTLMNRCNRRTPHLNMEALNRVTPESMPMHLKGLNGSILDPEHYSPKSLNPKP